MKRYIEVFEYLGRGCPNRVRVILSGSLFKMEMKKPVGKQSHRLSSTNFK